MSAFLQKEIATIVLWNLGAALCQLAFFALFYVKLQKKPVTKRFLVMQFAMIMWLTGKVFKTLSPTVELKWFCVVFYYFAIYLLEVSFIEFTYCYKYGRVLAKKWRFLLYTLGSIQFLVVLTNPYHHLFYSTFEFSRIRFGPMFRVNAIIFYIFTVIGMILCGGEFYKRVAHKSRWQRYSVSLSILIPLLVNILFTKKIIDPYLDSLGFVTFDTTPILLTWSLLVFASATFKHNFLELTPLMRSEVVTQLETPVVITNNQHNILYANTKFKEFFPNFSTFTCKAKSTVQCSTGQSFLCHSRQVVQKNRVMNATTLTDITEYQKAKKTLEEQHYSIQESNKKLEEDITCLQEASSIGARTFVARELHDIMGHSLVVSLKLLEMAALVYNERSSKIETCFIQAEQTIMQGFREIQKIQKGHHTKSNQIDFIALQREIGQILQVVEVSGIDIHYYPRGENIRMSELHYDVLKRVCTELITNILKHSHGTKLFLVLGFMNSEYSLQVLDNGVGVSTLRKGNGLEGIIHRVEKVHGKTFFHGSEGEGFGCHITIPYPS